MKFFEPKLGLELEIVDWKEFGLLPRLPAVYILGFFRQARFRGEAEFVASYIGKTFSLQEEFIENENSTKAHCREGCTHALILVERSKAERNNIAANLIVAYRPLLNWESRIYIEGIGEQQFIRGPNIHLFVS